MISLKEYKAAKEQVDQFERSVKVAALVNEKIVNFVPDDLTVIREFSLQRKPVSILYRRTSN